MSSYAWAFPTSPVFLAPSQRAGAHYFGLHSSLQRAKNGPIVSMPSHARSVVEGSRSVQIGSPSRTDALRGLPSFPGDEVQL